MSSINISQLSHAGLDLFQDSETFLKELGEQETALISGGGAIPVPPPHCGGGPVIYIDNTNTNTNTNTADATADSFAEAFAALVGDDDDDD